VEQNRDEQLRSMLLLETGAEKKQLHSILNYDGLPISSKCVVDGVMAHAGKEAVA
jgi:2-oxoglutarate ferredoxin oxidoreductase subunit alpha